MSTKRQSAIALLIGAAIAIGAWILASHYSSRIGAYGTLPGLIAAIPIWGVHGSDTMVFGAFVICFNAVLYATAVFVVLRIGHLLAVPKGTD